MTSLRGFAKWAGVAHPLEDYIAPTPGRAIPHPLPEGLDGVRRMISKAKNHQQVALIALCGYVGLRIAEALSIKTTDIDVQTMQLTVRGKGDKTRTIPISDSAWTYLSSAYVSAMGTEDHRLIHYRDRFARKIVTNLGAAAGLQRPVASHDLRATFATAVYDHTLDIRAVQELLGHSSSVTTEGYTMITLNTLKKAVDL